MKISFLLLISLFGLNLFSQSNQRFIENKGQWDQEVLFLAQINGMNAWITKTGISYDFYKYNSDSTHFGTYPLLKQEAYYKNHQYKYSSENFEYEEDVFEINGHAINLTFTNSNEIKNIRKINEIDSYINYYLGDDPKKWVNHVPAYEEILLKEIYNGIDLRFYFDEGFLRYDLKVKPHADLYKVRMKYQGQDSILINLKKELVIRTGIGEVIYKGLYAYQENNDFYKSSSINSILCNYKLYSDNTVGFVAAKYDTNSELIIDPFVFSTVFGAGDIMDEHPYLAMDSSKNLYVVGFTYYNSMPTTPGAYRKNGYGTNRDKNGDIIVSKISSDGSTLLYMTYIGGTHLDIPRGIVVDKNGNALIVGETLSKNYPTTDGVLGKTLLNDRIDFVLTKFNADASELIFSTLYGGDYTEQFPVFTIDNEDNIFIAGMTFSRKFPISKNAIFPTRKEYSYSDMFFSKINSTATEVLYSTFILGDNIDWAGGITLDKNKKVYLTGWTYSNDFFVTEDASDKIKGVIPNDSADVFLMILDLEKNKIQYSTYIGGNQSDRATCIAIDKQNNICLAGFTLDDEFPTTPDAYDKTYDGAYDTFFSRFSPDGKTLKYSTFFGGSENDWVQDISIDNKNNVYLIGAKQELESMTDTDTTKNARDFRTTVSRINSNNSDVDYYRLLGDTILSSNFGNCIIVDENEDIYIAGTEYWGFPSTKGAYSGIVIPKMQNGQPGSESSGGYIFLCKLNFKCDDMAYDYQNFSTFTNFIFNGSAKQENNKLKLTGQEHWESGSVWYRDKVHVESGFTTEFSFSIDNGYNIDKREKYKGADGLAFVIQNESPEALGMQGEWIGYAGITNSFAIEFDSFRNIFLESDAQNIDDPSESHVAIFSNGQSPNLSKHDSKACLATYDDCLDLVPDGRKYYVRIQYLQLFKTLQIYLDVDPHFSSPNAKSLTLMGHDIANFVKMDTGGKAWVGFTSATGIAYEEHYINNWSFCPFEYYGGITNVNEKDMETQKNFLSIYPNPAKEYIYIHNVETSLRNNSKGFFEIYNVLGECVQYVYIPDTSLNPIPHENSLTNLNTGNFRVDVSDLPEGVYFVRIGEFNEKFVVIK